MLRLVVVVEGALVVLVKFGVAEDWVGFRIQDLPFEKSFPIVLEIRLVHVSLGNLIASSCTCDVFFFQSAEEPWIGGADSLKDKNIVVPMMRVKIESDKKRVDL